MRVIARDGDTVLIADGEVGASVLPDGRTLVLPVASLAAQGDWEPADGPLPPFAPADLQAQIDDFRRHWK